MTNNTSEEKNTHKLTHQLYRIGARRLFKFQIIKSTNSKVRKVIQPRQ